VVGFDAERVLDDLGGTVAVVAVDAILGLAFFLLVTLFR
jgi:hypothetical protein